jgi:transcriptional regulator with XRE-family HTH domain
MDLSDKIKAIREAKNIKQIDVAKALELDPSYYFRLEKRGDKLTVEQLKSIAVALGVSVLELLTGEPQTVQSDERVKELEKRVEELDELNETQRKWIDILEKRCKVLSDIVNYDLENNIVTAALEKGLLKPENYDRFINVYTNNQNKLNWHWKREILLTTKPSDVKISMFMTQSQIVNSIEYIDYDENISTLINLGLLEDDAIEQAWDIALSSNESGLF